MKFGFIFSICALLLINFQLSAAVICAVSGNQKECSNDLNLKVCSSCVAYLCPDSVDGTGYGTGCPEDFFQQCSTHKNDIDFIKRQNYNDLEHMNLKDEVIYISGCAEESIGVNCILAKVNAFRMKIADNRKKLDFVKNMCFLLFLTLVVKMYGFY